MVDLMMWLVVAALLIAAAIQGIGYYQKTAYVYQMNAELDVVAGKITAAASIDGASITTEIINRVVAEENAARPNDSIVLSAGTLSSLASGGGETEGYGFERTAAVSTETTAQKRYVKATHSGVINRESFYFFEAATSYGAGVNVVDAGTLVTTSAQPYTPPEISTPCFPDAPGAYYTEICWFKARGIMNGYSTGIFGTDDTLNPNHIAKVMYKIAGSPSYTPPETSHFSDIPKSNTLYKEISWMYDANIFTGFPDGTYGSLRVIPRGEVAAYLYRLAGNPNYTPPTTSYYSDVPSTSMYYKEINWLYESGAYTGFPSSAGHPVGTFAPDAGIKRGEAAHMMYNWNQKFGTL
jgi:hypothetical protein